MSLLGIDVGTTGCKAVAFSEKGDAIASSYEEYDIKSPRNGYAELDTWEVWKKVLSVLAKTVSGTKSDPVKALSVTSMGEAMVPVSENREILGPSLLNFDERGAEYCSALPAFQNDEKLYSINGNTLANNYGLTKLLWIRDYQNELYKKVYKFLNWGAFVMFMLGSDPVIDYSLANRSLLFELDSGAWSDYLLKEANLDRDKLPDPVPSGTYCGTVAKDTAEKTGLPRDTILVTGAHDQCANALGCGVVKEGQAMYGMGTFTCIVPVFHGRKEPSFMIKHGLNTEHHAVTDLFATFIYNPGGAIVKWYRDTFAAEEHRKAQKNGTDIYDTLFRELPDTPSRSLVLPHFSTMGPPDFIDNSCGMITGLYLNSQRGEILKGIIESATYSLKESIDALPKTGFQVEEYRPAGGGSKSEQWVQISADIMGMPFTKLRVTEAGSLGAALLAGLGSEIFASPEEGIENMVTVTGTVEPDLKKHSEYSERYEKFKKMWPVVKDFCISLNA